MLELKIFGNSSTIFRSSHWKCSIRKAILKNFVIFTGKHLCWGLFLLKLQAFRPLTVLKRDFNTDIFLWISGNFYEHLFWRTRSSHQSCSVRKGLLRNLTKLQENTCARVSFLIKLQDEAAACNFINKKALARVFSCEFSKISENTILTEHLWTTAFEEHLRTAASAFLETVL